MNQIDHNQRFELAASFVNHTQQHIFLTGKAGTGKTTFLKYIIENSPKQSVVVAPTGVAAINAGGVTMHSFFQLPFGPYLPTNSNRVHPSIEISTQARLMRNIRFNKEKIQLIKQLELLIIDEVSMVRADMMDAIDAILRRYGKKPHKPFGGIQLLLIGDLYQLPPVARENEWNILKEYYQSPFFFDALAFSQSQPVGIELNKIYRQSDQKFIELLNKVRNNQISQNEIDQLNQKHNPIFRPEKEDSYITLSTHNHKANAINEKELNKLDGKLHEFKAKVDGQFNENAFPAEEVLRLKEGAQIMFIRNDKGEERRYYNGKIATVTSITKEGIFVQFPDDNETFKLERDEWENKRFTLDEENQKIIEDKLGTFSQYPIRLAWAITIHKSQGLTFDKAIIDAGDSFSAGQVYVALSRLTNLQGLVLHSRINADSISTDQRVVDFMQTHIQDEALIEQLSVEQKVYLQDLLTDSYALGNLMEKIIELNEDTAKRKLPKPARANKYIKEAQQKIAELRKVAHSFKLKIEQYIAAGQSQYDVLQKRIGDATTYFDAQFDAHLIQPLQEHIDSVKTWSRSKSYLSDLLTWQLALKEKQAQINRSLILCEGITQGKSIHEIFEAIEAQKLKENEKLKSLRSESVKKRNVKGETYQTTFELFQDGKSLEDIAHVRGMALSTIESHMGRFLKSGDVKLDQLMEAEKIKNIKTVIIATKSNGLNDIMAKLGSEYTYTEARWVLMHMQNEKSKI